MHRAAAMVAALVCALGFASALSAPAGALGASGSAIVPHNPDESAHTLVRAHDTAALTLANVVVTDLTTNQSTVDSTSAVTPLFNENA
ncbi:MAG TPA: hypothetical protein VIX84_20950, partial [Acidimicrobiales bacterium]